MFEDVLLFSMSSWVTAAFLLSVAWTIYNYSKDLMVEVNYWNYISSGMLFFASSEIARPVFFFREGFFWVYWILSVIGGVMVAYGFYRLYNEEKV